MHEVQLDFEDESQADIRPERRHCASVWEDQVDIEGPHLLWDFTDPESYPEESFEQLVGDGDNHVLFVVLLAIFEIVLDFIHQALS